MRFLCEILVAAMLVKDICIDAAVAGDEIDALPGWDAPLPSKQYSGYLDIPTAHGTGRMHYCPSTLCSSTFFRIERRCGVARTPDPHSCIC